MNMREIFALPYLDSLADYAERPSEDNMPRPVNIATSCTNHSFLTRRLRLGLFQHLLHDLLLLDQECSHDPVAHAVAASRSAVGP